MSFIDANLTAMNRRQPDLASLLRSLPDDGPVEVLPSALGSPTALYRRAGRSFPLHSRYNPCKEAERSLMKADLEGADCVILLGFGLGYILDALVERATNSRNSYFVIESDLAILRAALETRDLRNVLALPRIHFAWPVSGVDLARQWQAFFDPVRIQRTVFVTHTPSFNLNPAIFRSAAESIQSMTFQMATDINTLAGRSQTFLQNFIQNLPMALSAPGVTHYAGKFTGVPAVLVAAGPSLDKNIHELRSCEERALILATDTTLKPLLAAGIDPHFVLTGDPGLANYLHLKEAAASRALLVAEATAYPDALVDFQDRMLVCTFENSSLPAISDLLAHKGTLRAWGSVATMALDFALLLGCNPVIFAGQDLAHSDSRIYCSGLHFENEWYANVRDPNQWEDKCNSLRSQHRTISEEDIFGKPTETTDKLSAYWGWITKELHRHSGVRFINATEGGILKDGAEIMSLREALHRCCKEKRAFRRAIEAIHEKAQVGGCQDYAVLHPLQEEARAITSLAEQGIRLCKRASQRFDPQIGSRLQRVRDEILTNNHIIPLIDCFNQLGNLTFLRKCSEVAGDKGADSPGSISEIAYKEYFESIRVAMGTIYPALTKIESTLSERAVLRKACGR